MVMKVIGPGYSGAVQSTKRKSEKKAEGGFSALLHGASETAEEAAPVSGPGSVWEGMLALQEVSDEEVQRRKILGRGHRMLDLLEQLRLSLLGGMVPASQLGQLASFVKAQKERTNDPRLHDIVNEIEIRTAVELAKLEIMRGSDNS